jgi:putative nucleotidyltransferase with HDIG domain
MKMSFPARYIGQNLQLPSPPLVLSRLLQMLSEEDTSIDDLTEVILEDPGLTTRILQVANSSYYGFSNKIETVSHAIALIGSRAIRMLCASESFLVIFPQHEGNFALVFYKYCRHSLATALLAKIMNESLELVLDSEKAFIAGLLHDIGKPVLWYNFLEEADFYHDLRARGVGERDAERLAYGADHTEVGAWVAGEWGLDNELAKTMARHHENLVLNDSYQKNPRDYSLTDIVSLANILAKCFRFRNGRLGFAEVVDRFIQHKIPGLDWKEVAVAFSEQASQYGFRQLEDEARERSTRTFPGSVGGQWETLQRGKDASFSDELSLCLRAARQEDHSGPEPASGKPSLTGDSPDH